MRSWRLWQAWMLAAMAVVSAGAATGVRARADRPHALTAASAVSGQAASPAAGVAYFVRSLADPRERREARPDILDAPMLPGSVVKAVTLVSALESGAIRGDSEFMCRKVVTIEGVRYTCAHPDLKRPLSPAEALAHSCNDFFVSLAPRLTRAQVNRARLSSGLPPLGEATPLAPALVGLDGPRVTPRALVDVIARLAAVGPDPPAAMSVATRRVLMEGLAGAARYGTAAALGSRGISALAKTGTAPMPGGGTAGLVVALAPADRPMRVVVVVAPGGAGVDAAAVAADVLSATTPGPGPVTQPRAEPAVPAEAGTVRLGRTDADGRIRVETLALDTYVADVLAGEGQPNASDAAQQALAIAARTFAVANRDRHRREGFDLCDTTHCQVLRPATAVSRRAADATSGRLLLLAGRPAPVFYSAWCGGRVERASEVWPGATDMGHPDVDEACVDEPPWQSEARVADVERALRAAGLRGGRLQGLRVLQRNRSGRVVRVRAEGFTPSDLSGNDFRMAMGRIVGWQVVKSTAFEVERTGGGYRFHGRGYGHGVGLCVVGAGRRAGQGATTDAILRFYFPTLRVGSLAPLVRAASVAPALSPDVRPAPAPPVASALPAAPSDVLIALPADEESERETLVSLVRRARDATARLTGVPAPAALRVTVHPTLESFGRATGQPWWVTGATTGSAIALLPLKLLRQQGQLERTVRHEVTHAMLDGPLSTRPMWVREGAAIYFASAAQREAGAVNREPAGADRCPTDTEILKPLSAGAQREAYARAEACFARAMQAGRKWTEVR